jgi:hypothetical protein
VLVATHLGRRALHNILRAVDIMDPSSGAKDFSFAKLCDLKVPVEVKM